MCIIRVSVRMCPVTSSTGTGTFVAYAYGTLLTYLYCCKTGMRRNRTTGMGNLRIPTGGKKLFFRKDKNLTGSRSGRAKVMIQNKHLYVLYFIEILQ